MNLSIQYDIMNSNIQSVSHPLVADIYVKREYVRGNPALCNDVLVIEANFSDNKTDYQAYSAKLAELLMALPAIRDQVEDSVGSIDRVDIKTH
jgi:hypothetical protein